MSRVATMVLSGLCALLLVFLSLASGQSAARSEPGAIIHYDGQLSTLPTQVRANRFHVSIPEANNPRLVTNSDHGVSADHGMTRYSFPIKAGTEARVHYEAGRVEITFVPVEATEATALAASPSPAPVRRTSSHPAANRSDEATVAKAKREPIAEGPVQPISPANAVRNESIALGSIDMAVPESPAFTALGITPGTVTRPTSPRDFATSLLNGVDEKGNFQTGLALDTAPFLLFFGNKVTLEEYQTDYTTRFLSRTQLSFASSKGADEKDKSTKLALGLHLTFFDNGDPRLDDQLLQDFSNALHAAGGMTPIGFGSDADQQIADINARFNEGVAAAHARRAAERRDWNASSWSLGFAPSWINEDGDGGSYRWNGAAVWTSVAYGFENVAVLKDKAQFIGHLRYRNHEQVPDPDLKGSFLDQDSLLIGARLRIGAPDFNCSFDGAWVHEWRDQRESDSAYRVAFTVERKMAKNLWLSLSLGQDFDHEDGKNPTLLLGGLKFGYSQEPVLAQDRAPKVASLTPPRTSLFSPAAPAPSVGEIGKAKSSTSPEKLPPAVIKKGTQPVGTTPVRRPPATGKPVKLEDAMIRPGTRSLADPENRAIPPLPPDSVPPTGKPLRLDDATIKSGTRSLDTPPAGVRPRTGQPVKLDDATIKSGTQSLGGPPAGTRPKTGQPAKLDDATIKSRTRSLETSPVDARPKVSPPAKLDDATIQKGTRSLAAPARPQKMPDAEIKKGTRPLFAPTPKPNSKTPEKLKDAEIKEGTKRLN